MVYNKRKEVERNKFKRLGEDFYYEQELERLGVPRDLFQRDLIPKDKEKELKKFSKEVQKGAKASVSVIPKSKQASRVLKEAEFQMGRPLMESEKIPLLRGEEIKGRFVKRIKAFQPIQEDFSFQEEVLRQTFGRGEKIWGHRMEPVELNFDLNPRQRGETGTSELFGF